MWTVDYEADIASDLSAFHRVDDVETIDGPRYFSLALRLTAYAGVMAAIAAEIRRREEGGHPTPSRGAASNNERQRVDDTVALGMLADGWVEHNREGEG